MNRDQIGKAKLYFDRWKNYVGTVQALMILVLFVLQTNISWWWSLAGFLVSIAFMVWIDIPHIISAEYEAQQKKNWELTWRMNKIDHIEEMLEQLIKTDSKTHIDIRYPEEKK